MDKVMPRYKKSPAPEDLPKCPEQPELKICQVSDGKLLIPQDLRRTFLVDPIWGPEWRALLQSFDSDWGVAIPDAAPTSSPAPSRTTESTNPSTSKKEEEEDSKSWWQQFFKGDPTTYDEVKAKYGDDVTEMAGLDASTSFLLTPGPALYINAKEAVLLKLSHQPLICHGAGVWLLGEKAERFLKDHPGKGIPCSWTSDEVAVVIEDTGSV